MEWPLHQIPLHKKGNQKYLSAFTKSIQSKVQISSLLLIEGKNFMRGQSPKNILFVTEASNPHA
jgi:hypothetical protein